MTTILRSAAITRFPARRSTRDGGGPGAPGGLLSRDLRRSHVLDRRAQGLGAKQSLDRRAGPVVRFPKSEDLTRREVFVEKDPLELGAQRLAASDFNKPALSVGEGEALFLR